MSIQQQCFYSCSNIDYFIDVILDCFDYIHHSNKGADVGDGQSSIVVFAALKRRAAWDRGPSSATSQCVSDPFQLRPFVCANIQNTMQTAVVETELLPRLAEKYDGKSEVAWIHLRWSNERIHN